MSSIMAIEMYDEAEIVKKDDTFYYLLKFGSKNCYTHANQFVVDENFRNEFAKGQRRESDWHVIAHGSRQALKEDKIAFTEWNAPTSRYYGKIYFGNRKNIAQWYVKNKDDYLEYEKLHEIQQHNIDTVISSYENGSEKYQLNLDDVEKDIENIKEYTYCGKTYQLCEETMKRYNGLPLWNFQNL